MPFDLRDRGAVEALVAREHVAGGKSIREIERELGLGKTTLSAWCKRHGIAVRRKEEQVGITNRRPDVVAKRSGVNHPLFGRARPDAAERMRAANPTCDPEVRSRVRAGQAKRLRQRLTPTEAALLPFFAGRAEAQHVVGDAILDFAFVEAKVAVEVDGKNHWSAERKAHDLARDAALVAEGWRIVRIASVNVRRPGHLLRVLEELVPGLDLPRAPPDEPVNGRVYQYRVLVRDAEHHAGRKV